MLGQRVGYVRVSTVDQNSGRQLEGMELDRVFEDAASGQNLNRPKLKEMLSFVREGDTVLVHSMDRLGRNLLELRSIVDALTGRGVEIRFVKENLVFSCKGNSAISTLLLSVMGAFAEFERALIKERQAEGIALARTKGLYKGRKPALSKAQQEMLVSRLSTNENKSKLAAEFGISRVTLYKYARTGAQ